MCCLRVKLVQAQNNPLAAPLTTHARVRPWRAKCARFRAPPHAPRPCAPRSACGVVCGHLVADLDYRPLPRALQLADAPARVRTTSLGHIQRPRALSRLSAPRRMQPSQMRKFRHFCLRGCWRRAAPPPPGSPRASMGFSRPTMDPCKVWAPSAPRARRRPD